MNPLYIDLKQDTNDWKRWRAGGIGSSAAPIIMHETYRNPFQLWQQYMDLAAKPQENRYMARGKKLEPTVRDDYMKHTGNVVVPGCYVHPAFDYLRCSTDGGVPVKAPQLVVELKCPDKVTAHLAAREGQVPRAYYGQCQHLLMVTGAEELDYASWWHGELAIVKVTPDEAYTDKMLAAEHHFWKMVQDGRWEEPEGHVDMSADKEWMALAQRFKEIDELYNHYSELRRDVEAQMAQKCGMNRVAFGGGVQAAWTHTTKAAEKLPRKAVDSWSMRVEQIPDKRVD